MNTATRKGEPKQRHRGGISASLLFATAIAGCGLVGFLATPGAPAPQERSVTIRAHKYGYEPEILRVNQGDTLRLQFVSEDVVHGFYLEGYDVDVAIVPLRATVEFRRPSAPGTKSAVEEVVLTADRSGKFRYRCSQTCGFLHPFMLGELIVEPNRLLPTGLGLTAGVLLGSLFLVVRRKEEG